jgi:two-component system NtrC family sensor kinase
VRQGLTVILKQAERCQEITRRVLNFARKEEFHLEPLELGPLLEEVVALLEPQARQCEVRLHCHLASDLPLLESDTASLQQVFFNIVKNGIEAIMSEGDVSVSARRAGPHVEVTVTDTGAGIPAEWERKIFDPFFTTKPPGQGTGLGLPISCLLIEGLGGTLRFRSHGGRGTIFTVLLPAPQNGVGI